MACLPMFDSIQREAEACPFGAAWHQSKYAMPITYQMSAKENGER